MGNIDIDCSIFGDLDGNAIDESRCYYLRNDVGNNTKSFMRIEFYKHGFFYLQSFRSFNSDCRSGGSNKKYSLNCSDVINLMDNGEFRLNEDDFKVDNDEILFKFSEEEKQIIKFISYLFKIKDRSFNEVVYYLKKNIDCDVVDSVYWD